MKGYKENKGEYATEMACVPQSLQYLLSSLVQTVCLPQVEREPREASLVVVREGNPVAVTSKRDPMMGGKKHQAKGP